jgi:UPF0755 protein
MMMTMPKVGILVIAVVVLVLAGVGVQVFMLTSVAPEQAPVTIRIPPGVTFSWVCDQLVEQGLVRDRGALVLLARVMGIDRKLAAAEVTFEPGMSIWGIVWKLRQSKPWATNVTIPEGLTAKQIAGILHQKVGIDSAAFMKAVADSGLIGELGIEAPDLEGFLFPDTYNLYYDVSPKSVVRRMVQRFHQVWADSLTVRAKELGWTVREAVTMASIIQGEVKVMAEAPLVSSVYHNRLKVGMLLQADPTIQYIIPDGPRRLTNGDLVIDSPYNTYLHVGLPPGPINNPGLQAMLAALYPADSKYLYFVAKGDGSHSFNEDENGHWRDKMRLEQIRRKVELK